MLSWTHCHVGTASLAQGAISALENLACTPWEGIPPGCTQFPLARALSGAQAGQQAGRSAVAISRQVCSFAS